MKLTEPRRKALIVTFEANEESNPPSVSNYTSDRHHDATRAYFIYWQTAAWMVDAGLATSERRGGREYVMLTEAGIALAAQELVS